MILSAGFSLCYRKPDSFSNMMLQPSNGLPLGRFPSLLPKELAISRLLHCLSMGPYFGPSTSKPFGETTSMGLGFTSIREQVNLHRFHYRRRTWDFNIR